MPRSFLRFLLAFATATVAVMTAGSAGATHGEAQDEGIAEVGMVQVGDFPSGWSEDVGQNHLAVFVKSSTKVKECRGYRTARTVALTSPNAESSDYTNSASTASIASNDVTVVPSISLAEYSIELYDAPTTGKCLGKVLPRVVKTDLAKSEKVGAVTTKLVQPLTPKVQGADDAAGFRILMNALVNGKTTKVYVENWLVQVGRSLASFDFESTGTVFDATVATNAANVAVARLAQATGGAPVGGETAYLAKFLPTVAGFAYEQPPDSIQKANERQITDAEFASQINGLSDHAVAGPDGTIIAGLSLYEYKPEVASLPGFSSATDGVAAQDAESWSNPADGGTGVVQSTDVEGRPVLVVPMAAGYAARIFVCGRVEVVVEGFEDAGVPKSVIDSYVAAFIREAC